MVTHIVYTTPVFSRSKWRLLKSLQTLFSHETSGVAFQCKRTKRRLLKRMAWLPTFTLRILDVRVNNNIMLIVVPIDMYG